MTTLILNIAVALFAIVVTVVLSRKMMKTRKDEQKAVEADDLPHQAFMAYTRKKEASR